MFYLLFVSQNFPSLLIEVADARRSALTVSRADESTDKIMLTMTVTNITFR